MKRLINRTLALALCGAVLLTAASPAFAGADQHPAQAEIDYVLEHNLFQGTGDNRFSPDQPLTRAQAVAVLGRQAHISG